jgi:outer membrane receptor protein involved in Fe transport
MKTTNKLLACPAIALFSVVVSAHGAATSQVTLDLESQPVLAALNGWAEQTGLQIVVLEKPETGHLVTRALKGTYAAGDALAQLLAGTSLTYEFVSDRIVVIRPMPQQALRQTALTAAAEPTRRAAPARARQREATAETDESRPMETVIVTAQKRAERLIDVPQAVTVLSSAALEKDGATEFRDYANKIPGLGYNTTGAGHTAVNLRGLAATQFEIGSRVAQYVDEVPYGSSNPFNFGGRFTLDAALFDIERIEVLRGPQGTLYGASSMGGLIKYVTVRPDTENFSADLRTGISTTKDGGVSYNGALTVNAPLSTDKAALRVTAFEAHDGGFIDNVARGDEDANQSDAYGGRVDLLLTPNEQLDIRLSGFLQNIRRDGDATADYTFAGGHPYGELGQRRAFPESFNQDLRLFSGTVNYDFGPVTLTSVTGYQSVESVYTQDYQYLISLGGGAFGGLGSVTSSDGEKFTQEVRLASPEDGTIEWVVGGFFTHEDFDGSQVLVSRDLADQPVPNNLYRYSLPSKYQEYAAFGTVTWNLSEAFDVSAGLRYAHNSQEKAVIGSGTLGSRLNDPLRKSTDDVVTYLANARYHFSDNATGYVRYATGYKAGGPNAVVLDQISGAQLSPSTLEAETLDSYEIGFKADTADRLLSMDIAVFYTDWEDIQVSTQRGTPAVGVYLNTPAASVWGSELSVAMRPLSELTFSGAVAYTDAELSEPAPDLRGAEGERLPNVPRLTATLSADYELPMDRFRPTVGVSMRHVSDRTASYNANTVNRQYRLPSYEALDLRAGMELGSVALQLNVRNLLDERGQLSAYTFQGLPQVAILQPRTFGMSATVRF